ncbi:hypothetical protein GCK72_016656 [Caenorhabditis remanei]|uniref:Uncharacterized protein n=1 Tax=Caenorhabditis remanei TaxID=31234 RepID=A0A6A5G576_CAERE|nr:hypothetical protein GCK72_016656 [Caenorhabditis remanei]KAF1750110.1 hypothetical protein GCK72_016656 [Caenorhabditis remanei]
MIDKSRFTCGAVRNDFGKRRETKPAGKTELACFGHDRRFRPLGHAGTFEKGCHVNEERPAGSTAEGGGDMLVIVIILQGKFMTRNELPYRREEPLLHDKFAAPVGYRPSPQIPYRTTSITQYRETSA